MKPKRITVILQLSTVTVYTVVDTQTIIIKKETNIFQKKKSTSRQRSGKGAIRRRSPLQKPRWEKKLNQQSGTKTMKTYRKPHEQLFLNRWPLNYLNLTKNMKTYIRRQQHKNFKHQDIKQKEPPQKYHVTTS